MKNIERTAYLLATLFLGAFPPLVLADATNEDFSAVSKAVIELLQSRDITRFATELTPTVEDWRSVLSTNAAVQEPDPLAVIRQSAEYQRQKIEQSAKQLLARADSLHVDFSKGSLHAQIFLTEHVGTTHYPGIMAVAETLPFWGNVEIILTFDAGTNKPSHCDFKVAHRPKCASFPLRPLDRRLDNRSDD